MSTTSFAGSDVASDASKGYYLQGGVGTFSVVAEANLDVESLSGGTGGLGAIGYQFNPHFAVEVDAIYGSYTYDQDNNGITDAYTLDGTLVGPAVKGILPLGESLQLYGKFGCALLSASGHYTSGSSSTENAYSDSVGLPFDAIGLSYSVNNQVDLGVEYTGLLYIVANAGLLSVDATYHF